MRTMLRKGAHVTLAALTAVAMAIPAHAQKGSGPGTALSASAPHQSAAPVFGPMPATDFLFDVANIFSFDGFGDLQNAVFNLNVGANAQVIGIGWTTTQFADDPSFLSEMAISFGSTTTSFVTLRPGVADDNPGTASYSSGGVVDLIGLGLNFSVGANGLLKLEFFETFDDFANDWDGRYDRGTLTIRTATPSTVVPEPSTYALLATGFVAMALVARRRRA
jgi:hypothetical protein